MTGELYEDEPQQAAEYLRLAIALLGQHQIPISPLNYRIGYDYVSGKDHKIIEAFDELVKYNSAPTAEDLLDTYRKFYIQDFDVLESLRQELASILSSAQGDFSNSGDHLVGYADRLSRFAEKLGVMDASAELSAEVGQVIADTRETEQSHRNMQVQLTHMSSELETLRKELDRVREESMTDALTGVANRKAFDSALEQIIQDTQDEESHFALMLLDVDHFKAVNDNFGHVVGDKVLRFVATAIKRCVKGHDLVARYGGEEFAVIMKADDIDSALSIAELIRKTIAAGVLKDKQTQQSYGNVTISIGVAGVSPDALPASLVDNADQALYRAKESGRNRVELAA